MIQFENKGRDKNIFLRYFVRKESSAKDEGAQGKLNKNRCDEDREERANELK